MPQRTSLITGATDGIGLELARLLQARGERPLLLGRKPLEELALGEHSAVFDAEHYCQADLSREDCAGSVTAFLDRQGIASLDLVVLNAATGWVGPPGDLPGEGIERLVQVNVSSQVALTHALLPRLEAARGQLLFVGSIAAGLPAPEFAVYAATKAALEGFARSLREELRGRVQVQLVRPGATRTGMHAKSGLKREVIDWERFPPAESVARSLLKAVQAGSETLTVGAGNRMLFAAGRYLSTPLDWAMRKKQS